MRGAQFTCQYARFVLLGPIDPSFRALYGRLKFTARRHKFDEDSFSFLPEERARMLVRLLDKKENEIVEILV